MKNLIRVLQFPKTTKPVKLTFFIVPDKVCDTECRRQLEVYTGAHLKQVTQIKTELRKIKSVIHLFYKFLSMQDNQFTYCYKANLPVSWKFSTLFTIFFKQRSKTLNKSKWSCIRRQRQFFSLITVQDVFYGLLHIKTNPSALVQNQLCLFTHHITHQLLQHILICHDIIFSRIAVR